MQGDDVQESLARSLRVLAIAPLNRSFILEAGALEPLADLLSALPREDVEPVLYAISLLSREDDTRLAVFSPRGLERLLALFSDKEASPEVRATAAYTLTNLARSLQNRCGAIRYLSSSL